MFDRLALHHRQVVRYRHRGRLHLKREVTSRDDAFIAQNRGTLEHMTQLTNVAGPDMTEALLVVATFEHVERGRRANPERMQHPMTALESFSPF